MVTGGSRGIGLAIVRKLLDAGSAVAVVARDRAVLDRAVASLPVHGGTVLPVVGDVTDPRSMESSVGRTVERLGGLTILVNNAGVSSSAPLRSLDLEEWNRLMSVNATGTFLCTRAFLPGMIAAGWGRVVNVASVAGRAGAAYISAYAASKHAVIGFTRSVAAEVALRGVTVNAICPGYVETPMTDESIERIVARTGQSAEDVRGRIVAMNPQGRLIEPEEVAFLAVALCDPRARGINGQAIGVDGGALLA
jgi:NAD(P)-dependent dehydrogenase (short-subunit alcohol dehydrogenase family)